MDWWRPGPTVLSVLSVLSIWVTDLTDLTRKNDDSSPDLGYLGRCYFQTNQYLGPGCLFQSHGSLESLDISGHDTHLTSLLPSIALGTRHAGHCWLRGGAVHSVPRLSCI